MSDAQKVPKGIKFDTAGRRALTAWLAEKSRTQTGLGILMNVSASAVSRWATGDSRPDIHQRDALRAIARIRVEDWKTEDERESDRAHIQSLRSAARTA